MMMNAYIPFLLYTQISIYQFFASCKFSSSLYFLHANFMTDMNKTSHRINVDVTLLSFISCALLLNKGYKNIMYMDWSFVRFHKAFIDGKMKKYI